MSVVRWMVIGVAAAVSAFGGASASAEYRYDRSGVYVDFDRRPSILDGPEGAGGPHKIGRGDKGLVAIDRTTGKYTVFSATEDALYGLWEFSQYAKTRRAVHLRNARRSARWLAIKQRRTGEYRYDLYYDLGGGLVLRKGWSGALAQGLTASLLSRLYRATGEVRYLRQAERALLPLARPYREGGMKSRFLGTTNVFFEGYATLPYPPHTLAHHMFTVMGLYDISDLSRRGMRLFVQGYRSLVYALPRFDLHGEFEGRTAAWLAHVKDPVNQPTIFTLQGYFQEHEVTLLRALNSVRPHPRLRRYADDYARELRTICKAPGELCIFYGPK